MQVCLVRPPAVESFRFATTSITLPLGLAYIAAALEEAGLGVCVVDAVGDEPERHTRYYKGYLVGARLEDIAKQIPADVDIVGVTAVFTHEWPAVVQLIASIKKERPEVTVVVGGEHVTSLPEFSLITSAADALVVGEGEETVVALVNALRAGQTLRDIDGIAYRDGDRMVVNKRRARRTQVDEIAPPAWHHFDLEAYHRHRFVGGMYSDAMTVPILATRGCPYQCTYCSAPNMWLPRWIPRDPIKVVDEIEHYVRAYGARNFPFQDLTAIVRKDWIVRFCRELIDRKLDITWQLPTGTRSEAIDREVARLLKLSGMVSMAYAPESGSETTRKLIKKKMKTDHLFDSIEAAASDLNVAAFLVIGFPHDSPESLAENLPFIDRLAVSGVTDVSVGYYMALPGTELFHSLYDAGQIKLDRAYFRHILDSLSIVPSQSYCSGLGRIALTKWKLRMFYRFYRAKPRSGLGASVRRALSGMREGGHSSKLQTAVRNGLNSALATIGVRFSKPWIDAAAERAMFAEWDACYRRVRRHHIREGIALAAPADTTELHRNNVIASLSLTHQAERTMPVAALPDGA